MTMTSIFKSKKLKLLIVPLIIFLFLALVLGGCAGMSSDEIMMARIYATQYALDPVNNIPPAHYQTLAAQNGYVLPIVASTPTPAVNPNWTPTMSFYDFSGTQVAQQQSIAMTNQAQELQLERERLAAEQRAQQQATAAYFAQETAAAYRIESTANAQATQMQHELDVQGTQMMATAQAQATSTAFQFVVNSQNTALAVAATNAVQPTHAIWTQTAIVNAQIIAQGEARQVQLAVRRQELKNGLDAFLPWGILVSLTVVVGMGFSQFVKTRAHQRDAFGDMPLIERMTKGGVVYIKSQLLETGVVKVNDDGSVVRYAAMDKDEQSRINHGAQIIEGIRALPSQYADSSKKMVLELSGQRPGSRVTISQDLSMNPVLDEVDRNLLEEAKDA
jgi:hypothetical protein